MGQVKIAKMRPVRSSMQGNCGWKLASATLDGTAMCEGVRDYLFGLVIMAKVGTSDVNYLC